MLIQYFPETPGHGMPEAPPGLDSQNFFFSWNLCWGKGQGKLAVELSQQAEKQTEK